MKNFKCTFEAQKGNPNRKNADFNPIKVIVVPSKFKSGARTAAEEELKLWDPEFHEKYRAPIIDQATDLELQEYETRKSDLLGSVDNGTTEYTEPEKGGDQLNIDVLEFPINQPWKILVGLVDNNGNYQTSMAIVNSKNNAIAFGNVESIKPEQFSTPDNAIVHALGSSIDAIIEYMADNLGSDLDSTVRIIKGYCTLKENEKLNRIKETILVNAGSENLNQQVLSDGTEDAKAGDQDAMLMDAINECIGNYGDIAPDPEECYESLMLQVTAQGNIDIEAMAEAIRAVKNPFVMTHSTTSVNFVAGFTIENEEPEQEEPKTERDAPISAEGKAMLDATAEASREAADKEWPKGEPFEDHAQTVNDRAPDYVYDTSDLWQSLAYKMLVGTKEQDQPTAQQYQEIAQKISGIFGERNLELMNGEFFSEVASEMIRHASGSETIIATMLNLREMRKLIDSVVNHIGTEDGQEQKEPVAEQGITISSADINPSDNNPEIGGEVVNENANAPADSWNGEWTGGDDTSNPIDTAIEELNAALDELPVGQMLILDDIPNDVYHGAKGISSSNIKEEMISSLYRHNRETGEIERAQKKCFDFGNYIHTLLLQPHLAEVEYAYERELPEGGFDSTESLVLAIDEENKSRQPLASNDQLKALIDAHNASLVEKLPTNGNKDEIAEVFNSLPEDFKLLGPEEKENATTFKKYINAYNDTLPSKLKTTGNRESLLAEVAKFNPEFIANEEAKKPTLPTSGTKKELAERIRSFKPDAVFKHELDELWVEEQKRGLIPVSIEDAEKGKRIYDSAMNNPAIKNWYKIENEATACERSYFVKRSYPVMVNGKIQQTELILKARLDKEIGEIIVDTKTIELRLDVKAEDAEMAINREIEKRGYHISAAHYLDVTGKGKFFWIFHNKLKGYEWEFIMEANADHIELGQYEIADSLLSIARSEANEEFKAPITQPVGENGAPLPLKSQVSSYANSRLEMFRKMNGETI